MPPENDSKQTERRCTPTPPASTPEPEKAVSDVKSDIESRAESDADSDAEYLADRFGALLSIGAGSLERLACRIRRRSFEQGTETTAVVGSTDCQLKSRLNGSYNVVHVVEFADGVKYVIRVPITAQEGRFNETAKQEMRAHALTLRYLRAKIDLPVPDILDFDTTHLNEIDAPYLAMSFLEGTPLWKKWFGNASKDHLPTDATSELANLRHRVLDTVAEAMSKLKDLEFDKIGSLCFASDNNLDDFRVGPCYRWDEGDPFDRDDDDDDDDNNDNNGDNDINNNEQFPIILEFGPFSSSRDFLKSFIENDRDLEENFPLVIGARTLASWMIDYLPLSSTSPTDPETFVLSPPDFDTQNFLIDDDGNLTGILDWDTVHTVPRYVGYALYPGWITRDWDPLMYGHPSKTENTPEQLEAFRGYYNEKMQHLLAGQGDYRFTPKAHIFENVVIAVRDSVCRSDIVHKILTTIFPDEDDGYSFSVIASVGKNELEPDIEELVRDGFKKLLSI